MKTKAKRTSTGAIVAAVVILLLMAAVIAIMIWGQIVDPIPLPILLFLLLCPAAVCVGVLIALRSRLKEAKSGEEEKADKY